MAESGPDYSAYSIPNLIARLKDLNERVAKSQNDIEDCIEAGYKREITTHYSQISSWNDEIIKIQQVLSARELQDNISEEKSWFLINTANNTQFGSPEKLAEGKRLIQSSYVRKGEDVDSSLKMLQKRLDVALVGAEELQRGAEELQRRTQKANNRVQKLDRRTEELLSRVQESERRVEELQQAVGAEELQAQKADVQNLDRRAEELLRRIQESERRVEELQQAVGAEELRAQKADVQNLDRRAEELLRRSQELDRRAQETDRRAEESQRRVQESERRVEELQQAVMGRAESLVEVSHDTSKPGEADNVQQGMDFSLVNYPSLPKLVDEGWGKVLTGFSADSEISVMYKGESGSLGWKEYDLTLLFESSGYASELGESPIHVMVGESGAFRLPHRVEMASKVYHINCPKQLDTTVTIRIKHEVSEEDIQYLCFITCSEDQPPYDYKILHGGNFILTYAEISVRTFSSYALGLLRRYGVRGLLSIMERTYVASLHCSRQPTHEMSRYSWKIYVSAVKNCSCFRNCIKKFIKEEYEEDVKMVAKEIVRFTNTGNSIKAVANCGHANMDEIYLKSSGAPSIKKTDISKYVDATPPHIRYDLQVPTLFREASIEISVTLEGLEEPNNYLCCRLSVPPVVSPDPGILTHQESLSCGNSGCAFTMRNLTTLDIGSNKQLHVIEEISPQWRQAADLLKIRDSYIRVIKENHQNVIDCCREVMAEWLRCREGTYHYLPNWNGLCKLLSELELSEIAQQIRNTVL